jgi:NtrC-family two-component system sensor histidine kinase KinB
MVKNLLEVYRYDQTTPILNLQTVDLRFVVRSVVKEFALPAQMRELKLESMVMDDLSSVHADEMAIRHVLTNLVDNAIKFTPRNGVITVSAHSNDGCVTVEVKDTGKGISQEDLPKLFQRFFQSEAGRKQYTGTGLGLYLCNQIVQAHGGKIRCQSEPRVGTSFIVTLPSKAD